MAIDLEQYQKLKDKVDKLQRESDRAEGALEEVMKELASEFKCDSLSQAEKLATKLRKESDEAEKDYQEALDKFEEKWEDVLNE